MASYGVTRPGTTNSNGIRTGLAGESMPRPISTPRRARTVRRARERSGVAALAAKPTQMAVTAAEDISTYQSIFTWLRERLPGRCYSLPACKRLAILVSGLLVKPTCTLGALAAGVEGLAVSDAGAESIERRLRRTLHDERMDPTKLLSEVFRRILPELLAPLREQAASQPLRRQPLVRIIVDETSHTDRVHMLVAGLAYRGIVVPLLVRTWQQNTPQPEGAYHAELHALLHDVQRILPPELRSRVLLIADRGYGTARMIDLLLTMGWQWLLRVQGQTHVRLPDGTTHSLRSLTPRPGLTWFGPHDPDAPPSADDSDPPPVHVFKTSGWRQTQVVAAWASGTAEPWLLLTSLKPSRDAILDYTRRWSIERLFLSWKTHGWQLEASQVRDPARFGRLLSGMVIATLWRLAAGVAHAEKHLAALRRRALRQLRVPPAAEHHATTPLPRPYAAKRGLFTQGTDCWQRINGRHQIPPLLWTFLDWEVPTWNAQASRAAAGLFP